MHRGEAGCAVIDHGLHADRALFQFVGVYGQGSLDNVMQESRVLLAAAKGGLAIER